MEFISTDPIDSSGAGPLRALLNASATLPTGNSVSDVLSAILDLAGRIIAADAYGIWQTHDDGVSWDRVQARGLSASYPTHIQSKSPYLPVGIQIVHDVESDTIFLNYSTARRSDNIRSILGVPLNIDGKNAGLITFYWRSAHEFQPSDTDYAIALANISTTALNLSRLQEQNQREKYRLSFLAKASAVLSASLDYEKTLERVAQLAVPHIADWCAVYLEEDGVVTRTELAHADPAWKEFQRKFDHLYPSQIRPDRGVGAVLRTGKSEVLTVISDEMLVALAKDDEHLRMLREFHVTSSITVPLISREKPLGALILVAAGGDRHFTPEDVQLAEDLGHRAGAAIENARLHRTLIEQQNTLRMAHSAAKMGSWSFDLVHGRLFWSDEFKALHGLSMDAVPSYEAGAALVHPEDRDKTLQYLSASLASGASQINSEHRILDPEGRTLWIHSRGRIERDADGKPIAISGISMDVTDRHQTEEVLRRTEKLAAAGRLAATVAHEVNNPLESIVNLVYISKHTPGLPAEVVEYLGSAESELSRLSQIVRQTLGFYREPTQPAVTDIGLTVSQLMELYRPRVVARSIQLTSEIEPLLLAHVVAGEIKQVVANLLSNASDATPSGGTIHVTVKRVDAFVDIVVADSGTGIDDLHLAHLFEPFFTTKAEVGTGLGLWVSKGIVEKHNGTIEVVSHTQPPQQGTTFTVTLPLDHSQHSQ